MPSNNKPSVPQKPPTAKNSGTPGGNVKAVVNKIPPNPPPPPKK